MLEPQRHVRSRIRNVALHTSKHNPHTYPRTNTLPMRVENTKNATHASCQALTLGVSPWDVYHPKDIQILRYIIPISQTLPLGEHVQCKPSEVGMGNATY